jgi:hypothetical protein
MFVFGVTTVEPDIEPTEADMRRMSLIADELAVFGKELELRVKRAEGSA